MNTIYNKRKMFIILVISILVISSILCLVFSNNSNSNNTSVHADYMYFDGLKNITNKTEAIISGKVISTYGPKKINIANKNEEPMEFDYVISEILVLDVIKGNVKKGDIITLKQNTMSDIYKLNKNDEGIMFLYDFRDLTDIAPFMFINPAQGFISKDNPDLKHITSSDDKQGVKDIWEKIKVYAK